MLNQVKRKAALLRSTRFTNNKTSLYDDKRDALILHIGEEMVEEMQAVCSALLGPESCWPVDLIFSLGVITTAAYNWNRMTQCHVLEHNLKPFAPFPQSLWNSDYMVPFEGTGVDEDF